MEAEIPLFQCGLKRTAGTWFYPYPGDLPLLLKLKINKRLWSAGGCGINDPKGQC